MRLADLEAPGPWEPPDVPEPPARDKLAGESVRIVLSGRFDDDGDLVDLRVRDFDGCTYSVSELDCPADSAEYEAILLIMLSASRRLREARAALGAA